MRNRQRGSVLVAIATIVLLMAFWRVGAQAPSQAPAPGPGAGRGPAGSPEPTPRLPDGTPNLGRIPGEKGVWNVPYITNMGERIVGPDGTTVAEKVRGRGGFGAGRGPSGAPLGGGEGTAGGGRGGSKSEPMVPFMSWSAAMYDYNSKNQ